MIGVSKKVKEFCEDVTLTTVDLRNVMDIMSSEICKGLCKKTNPTADIKCFPTYVRNIPNGLEEGKFLALDLGGTNFRIYLIELGKDDKMVSKSFIVPQGIMLGPGEDLFDFIAECLARFVKENGVKEEKLKLGFTFSFPLKQEGLRKGRLVKWTKGFNCSGVIGENVVDLLQSAINKRGLEIDVVAILNDTTGTLVSCAQKNKDCFLGVIIGTGTNACYLEKLENVEVWDGDWEEPKQVLINTEWGSFGGNGCLDFIRTEFDVEIDRESINPGEEVFGKMISGMYLGELVRKIILKMAEDGILFDGQVPDILYKKESVQTEDISAIESDKVGEFYNCRDVLKKLGFSGSDQDCQNIRYICEVVSKRAAPLAAVGVACILNRINKTKVVVGMDGSVYRFHPHFHNLMVETIEKLVSDDMRAELVLSAEGSGRGAAVVAALACRKA